MEEQISILNNDLLLKILSGAEYQLYVALKSYTKDTLTCFPKVKALAKKLDKSPRQIHRTLNKLEEKGVIKREHRYRKDHGYSSNLYTLLAELDTFEANHQKQIK